MDDRERRRAPIRLGVAVLLLLLPAQFALSFFVDELYPGITGPGFAGRPAKGGVVRFVDCKATVTCDGGEARDVACAEMIGDSAHRSVFILRGLFPQQRPQCEEPQLAEDAGLMGAAQYLRARIARSRARCEPLGDDATRWMEMQATAAADCKAEALDLVWHDAVIDPSTGARTATERARHRVRFAQARPTP